MDIEQIKKSRKILKEVADKIEKHPKSYDQTNWCGTACCIAGHIVTSNPNAKYVFSSNFIYGRKDYFVPDLAIKLLHLNTKNDKDRADVAVAFIREHVIPNYFPLKDEKKK